MECSVVKKTKKISISKKIEIDEKDMDIFKDLKCMWNQDGGLREMTHEMFTGDGYYESLTNREDTPEERKHVADFVVKVLGAFMGATNTIHEVTTILYDNGTTSTYQRVVK